MNRYLTDMAKQKRVWHVPAGSVSALFTGIAAAVWAGESVPRYDTGIWVFAHLAVMGMMAWPLIHIVRWRLRQRKARVIADRLSKCEETVIPLERLDSALGVRNAARQIEQLKRHGFIQRVEIEDGCLVLDGGTVEPPPEPVEESGDDIIARIRYLNDEIDDEAVSQRIERIERVTASILDTLEARPDRAEDARRFMNYYLPTTLKLLESYRLMEKQSYQGQTSVASRHRIEEALDKLVAAAEAQQDRLFSAEAMDVEAEISVLETMMTSDGMKGE